MRRTTLAAWACTLAAALWTPAASADVFDDMVQSLGKWDFIGFFDQLGAVPQAVDQTCTSATAMLSRQVDATGQSLLDGALADLNLAGNAADTVAAALAGARRLQGSCPTNIDAAALQQLVDWDAQARRAVADARGAVGQMGDAIGALRRTARAQAGAVCAAGTTDLQSKLVGPLQSFLSYLNDPLKAPPMTPQALVVYLMGETNKMRGFVDDVSKQVLATASNAAVSGAVKDVKTLGAAARQGSTLAQSLSAQAGAALDRIEALAASKPCAGSPPGGAGPGGGSPPGSGGGAPGSGGSPAPGSIAAVLFGGLSGFDLDRDQSRVEDYESHQFGMLNGQPRVEGRKTTLHYVAQYAASLPGALGTCRHFADAARAAGAQVLADNARNGVTIRYVGRGGNDLWAEIGCDKDRYQLIVVERAAAGAVVNPPDAGRPAQ